MTTVREFLTKFGFQVEGDKLDKLDKQLSGIKSRLNAIAGIEVARALFDLGERFAQFGEELHVAALSAGLTVESFQQMAFAAKQNAVSQEEMEHSLFRLSRRLYDARNGSSEAQLAFARVGFSPEQVAGFKTSQDVMLALSDRFKTIQDPIQKSALAMELMGRGSLHMVGFLTKGSVAIREQMREAQRLGLVLSGPQVEALVRLEHALQKLWATFKAIGATIAAFIGPSIEYLIKDFLEFFAVNRDLVQVNLESWLERVAYAMGFVYGVIKGLIIQFQSLAEFLHIDKDILKLAAEFAGFALAVFGLVEGVTALAAAGGALMAVFSPLYLLLGSIVFLIHEIYAALNGGFGSTWTGRLVNWAGGLADSSRQSFQGAHQDWFGGGNDNSQSSNSSSTSNVYNMEFHGSSEETVRRVQAIINENQGRQQRETYRSVQSPIAR